MRGVHKASLLLALVVGCGANASEIDPAHGCLHNPAIVEACRWVKGSIRGTNGTPSMRLFVSGIKRVLGIVPDEEEIVPPDLAELYKSHRENYIRGEFQFCPTSREKPGWMQFGCIEAMRHVTTGKL
jgi:hypothetical protein